MIRIPKEVQSVVSGLEKKGFEAYVVGGCVRDLLLEKEPDDWDVATSAKPEEVQSMFPDNFYENTFFTVTVRTESKNPVLQEIEITTYRQEFEYADRRRPDKVEYAKTIEEDLSRRDFTVNAIALRLAPPRPEPRRRLAQAVRGSEEPSGSRRGKPSSYEMIDPYDGQKDLAAKLIRAVGKPDERFKEDALRMMRAVRIAAVLGFTIEDKTQKAIQKDAALIKEISQERIRDEFLKIIMSKRAMEGIEQLRELGLLQYIIPELQEGYGVSQNKHHTYTVWEHNLLSLKYTVEQDWDVVVRIASLLHDVAKPRVKRGQGRDATFHGHEVVGGRMTKQILERLKFPKKEIEKITKLVRFHLFYYNVDEVTESSVRRLVRNVGAADMQDLLKVRMADRIGSGVPKAEPYKLRHLQYIIEKVSQDPVSPAALKISGNDVMKIGEMSPGPKVGQILEVLLGEVLEDPKKNTKKYLEKKTEELLKLKDNELEKLVKKAKAEKEGVVIKRDEMTKKKYWV